MQSLKIVAQGASGATHLPPLAAALLLDEWRRATMEGQGGWFARLPGERYDGHGNLWTVVRRTGEDNAETLVLVCEERHYQALSARNDLHRLEHERGQKSVVLRSVSVEFERSRGTGAALKTAQLTEQKEALEEDLFALAAHVSELERIIESRRVIEHRFPIGLGEAGPATG